MKHHHAYIFIFVLLSLSAYALLPYDPNEVIALPQGIDCHLITGSSDNFCLDDLSNGSINISNFYNTYITNITNINITHLNITNINITNINITNINITQLNLTNITNVNITNINITNINFDNTSLISYLSGNWTKIYGDITGLHLNDSKYDNTSLISYLSGNWTKIYGDITGLHSNESKIAQIITNMTSINSSIARIDQDINGLQLNDTLNLRNSSDIASIRIMTSTNYSLFNGWFNATGITIQNPSKADLVMADGTSFFRQRVTGGVYYSYLRGSATYGFAMDSTTSYFGGGNMIFVASPARLVVAAINSTLRSPLYVEGNVTINKTFSIDQFGVSINTLNKSRDMVLTVNGTSNFSINNGTSKSIINILTDSNQSTAIEISDKKKLRMFVTASTYNGNLGGTTGADAKCMADANKPSTGIYKALLGSATTPREVGAADWVLLNRTAYYKTDGSIVTNTDSYAKLRFNFMQTLGAGINNIWVGLSSDHMYESDLCNSWTSSSSSDDGEVGSLGAISFAFFGLTDVESCDELNSLVCVEQDKNTKEMITVNPNAGTGLSIFREGTIVSYGDISARGFINSSSSIYSASNIYIDNGYLYSNSLAPRLGTQSTHFGDLKINSNLNVSSYLRVGTLTGSGNDYVCVDANGLLFRSNTPC